MRIDTVFRASIGYVRKLGSTAQTYEKNFVLETARSNIDLLLSVNSKQLLNLILISDDKVEFFNFIQAKILSVPYASPRATFLQMLRKYHKELVANDISKRLQINAVNSIETHSQDSEIILNWCVPPVRIFLENIKP